MVTDLSICKVFCSHYDISLLHCTLSNTSNSFDREQPMKRTLKVSLALATALVVAPIAQASADQTPGWYAGAGAGGTFAPDADIHTKSGSNTLEYNPGYNLNISGGYAWTNGLRTEAEIFHSRTDTDKIKGGTQNNGGLSNTDLFGNLFYDFHTGTIFTPYLGVGAGVAEVGSDNIGVLNNGTSFKGTNTEFAYQGIGGIAAQLDPNWALTADYRYVATPDPKVHVTSGRGAYLDNQSHNIVVGIRYSFDEPAAPVQPLQASLPPKVYAPAVAKPVVAPIAQSYTVFFDFNKSVLTPEAERILASAAQDYKKGGYVRIVVTGHTDTVGTNAYNQKLSNRRAAAIKASLQKLGVDVSLIKAAGVGKNGLLVPTQDGVREAQNRRGEIVFVK